MPFPLLIPLVVGLVGGAVASLLEDEPIDFDGKLTQFETGPSGHGLTLRVTFDAAKTDELDGAFLVVRPKKGSAYIKSSHKSYRDKDGDIVAAGPMSRTGQAPSGAVHIPFAAFPEPDAIVDLEVVLGKDNIVLGQQVFGGVKLEATKFDRANALAAMCDAAMGAVRLQGPVAREHVRAVRPALSKAWHLDEHGLEAVRRSLKRAVATPLDSPWFEPARLARDIGDQLEGGDRTSALHVLYSVVGATGTVEVKCDEFLCRIARILSIEDDIRQIREQFTSSLHLGVLGLPAGATVEQIKAAYRRVAKECHPDVVRHADDARRAAAAERFGQATRAYEALLLQVAARSR